MQDALALDRFGTRVASLSDLPAICAIEDDSFLAPYPPALLERLLKECSDSFFVATDDSGKLVGYCVCSSGGKSAHLISIAVRTGFRRKGVAKMLLKQAIGYLTAHAVDELWLEVNFKNLEAVTLYRKLGFEKMGVLKKYYSDGSDAVSMRIVLRGPIPKPAKAEANRPP